MSRSTSQVTPSKLHLLEAGSVSAHFRPFAPAARPVYSRPSVQRSHGSFRSEVSAARTCSDVPSFVFDFLEERMKRPPRKARVNSWLVVPPKIRVKTERVQPSPPKQRTTDLHVDQFLSAGSLGPPRTRLHKLYKPVVIQFSSRSKMTLFSARALTPAPPQLTAKEPTYKQIGREAKRLPRQVVSEPFQPKIQRPAYSYAEKVKRVQALIDITFTE